MISQDGMTALIPVEQQIGEDADRPVAAGELGAFVDTLVVPAGAQADVTGEWPMWSDFNKMNEEALHKAELVSGIPTVIMLVIAFGALLAAGIPLLLAVAGIAVGFALLHVLSWVTPMSVWSMNFSMMIGLAVGIDYSLFSQGRLPKGEMVWKVSMEGGTLDSPKTRRKANKEKPVQKQGQAQAGDVLVDAQAHGEQGHEQAGEHAEEDGRQQAQPQAAGEGCAGKADKGAHEQGAFDAQVENARAL